MNDHVRPAHAAAFIAGGALAMLLPGSPMAIAAGCAFGALWLFVRTERSIAAAAAGVGGLALLLVSFFVTGSEWGAVAQAVMALVIAYPAGLLLRSWEAEWEGEQGGTGEDGDIPCLPAMPQEDEDVDVYVAA